MNFNINRGHSGQERFTFGVKLEKLSATRQSLLASTCDFVNNHVPRDDALPDCSSNRSRPIDQKRLMSDTFLASVEHHRSLSSTNDRAKALARESRIDLPRLVVTDHQTAGRGRGTNRWWTGPGSLAFSLLLNSDLLGTPREQMPLTALVAGVALVEAVAPRVSQNVGLHWPNDLYVGERKLAGILVEMPTENRLVVGVGINTNCRIADAPAELSERVTTLIDLTLSVQDHTSLLLDWLIGWGHWSGRLPTQAEEIGRRADGLCLQSGRRLRIRHGAELHEGRCLGIASDGALRLETKHGIRDFHSGAIE